MITKTRSVIKNPPPDDLKNFAAQMPQAELTRYGNYNINTSVTARSAESTFFASDKDIGQKCMPWNKYQEIVAAQDEYIAANDMILVEGCIGPDPDFQVGCSLLIEKKNANIAAMQQQLYFQPTYQPSHEMTVIYTPNLSIQGYPNNRVIVVDLESYTTRIIGSDYFGESKKGGLRMWNQYVFDNGGLGLHAGCKIYPDINGEEKLILIIGLSGTGKTTTTFRSQLDSLPVQDDFCALLPGGLVKATENGCFAKTYGLERMHEPVIYDALVNPDAWLENVTIKADGEIDFLDGSRTTNGRGTFTLDQIPHRNPTNLPPVSAIILLNRNFNIIPAVAKLKPEQAAAYFMLGETTGTSAGGASEAGKFLRVPGTNPFFCRQHALQGNRFFDLLRSTGNIDVYLFNTGCVGGKPDDESSIKVRIQDSSTILEEIMQGTISWAEDKDFGYFYAQEVPGLAREEILQPFSLYRSQGRENEYISISGQIQKDRREFLNQFDGLYMQIINAV